MHPGMGDEMDGVAAEARAMQHEDRFRAILEEACRITGMGFAAIARVTEERWVACHVLDKIEFGLDAGDELKIKTTICDDIRACGRAVVIDHVSSNDQWRTHPTPMMYGFESYASFPIVLGDGTFFGTLCAIDPAPHVVSTAEIGRAMERLAGDAGRIVSERREFGAGAA